MQREASGTVSIPQADGTHARFTERELADAYLVALGRELGSSHEDHPLCQAARNSPDPKWRESVYAGPEKAPAEVPPDLSE
jgi:hypothetical protein